ncbi:hypothetical protein [Bacillus sp. B1-b2]|uniref:hypothetical protein n=1 Tax=Bacillus sp. B1-b2 TaxID=2653201 RepID=UPI00126289AD|nr:hypothetical protein [Bacillus sp. B1-b2]KAB7665151.1 hypothetical protein F9279_21100 [Bacillus sp. B1-b2]
MTRYNKIIINGEITYRGFNEATGFYDNEVLTEEELIEELLGEVVEDVIEIDKGQIERAISCIPTIHQREMVQNYLDYLECLVESME